jgi:hypothetical protein
MLILFEDGSAAATIPNALWFISKIATRFSFSDEDILSFHLFFYLQVQIF